MYREGLKSLTQISVAEVPTSLRGRNNTIRFLMPLAHVICDANKSRAMIGYLTTDNFEPGKIPEPDTWFKPADFSDDQARQQQANELDGQSIASIFIRFESGHSNNITIAHSPFRPDNVSTKVPCARHELESSLAIFHDHHDCSDVWCFHRLES